MQYRLSIIYLKKCDIYQENESRSNLHLGRIAPTREDSKKDISSVGQTETSFLVQNTLKIYFILYGLPKIFTEIYFIKIVKNG